MLFRRFLATQVFGSLNFLRLWSNPTHPPSVRNFWDGPISFSDGIFLGWGTGFDFTEGWKKVQIYQKEKNSPPICEYFSRNCFGPQNLPIYTLFIDCCESHLHTLLPDLPVCQIVKTRILKAAGHSFPPKLDNDNFTHNSHQIQRPHWWLWVGEKSVNQAKGVKGLAVTGKCIYQVNVVVGVVVCSYDT